TAVTTNMVRLNGWSPRGQRLIADVPMGDWETVTLIAGFRPTGIIAPMLIKGAMNGEAFLAYIEHCLGATLKRRDIVAIDNVSFHKVTGVQEAIQAVGAQLRYLPQYSPDGTHNQRPGATRWLVHSSARPLRMYRIFQACWL